MDTDVGECQRKNKFELLENYLFQLDTCYCSGGSVSKHVSRKADQIQRQCPWFSASNMAIKGYLETIALEPTMAY